MSQDLIAQDKLKFLVVDDHEAMIKSTVQALQEKYPEVEIYTAKTAEETRLQIIKIKPNLISLDLQIPETTDEAKISTGIRLLEQLLNNQEIELDIIVVSANIKTLVQLKDKIYNYYGGGFGVEDKSSIDQLLVAINKVLGGGNYYQHLLELRSKQLHPNWLKVLQLAWDQGLTDKAIAKEMNYKERTIRVFWSNIYAFFDFPSSDKRQHDYERDQKSGKCQKYEIYNYRIIAIKKAIEKGYIDL